MSRAARRIFGGRGAAGGTRAVVRRAAWSACEALESRTLLSVAAPTGLVGARVSGTSVGLFWADNSNEDHFVVERSATAATGPFTILNSAVAQNATTFPDTTATAGTTYYYRVKATKTGDADSPYSNVIAVTPSVLPGVPSTWSTLDVGTIPSNGPGSGTETAGTFTLSSQAGDIGNQPDAFRFVYRDITGDFTIVAKVVSENSTKDWAKAGIMIRESTGAGGGGSQVHGAAFMTTPYAAGRQQLQFVYVNSWANYAYPYSQSTGAFQPVWLKLTRTGDQIEARYSTDGTTWPSSPSASGTVTGLATTVKVGLVVSSNQVNLNNTAQFAEVSGVGPESVLGAAASSTAVNLAWTDHTTNETGFVVERSPDGTTNWSQVGSTLPADTTTYTDTSAAAATTYYYRVKAVGPNVYSAASAGVTTPTPPVVPPGGVQQDPTKASRVHSVALKWNDVTGETGYVVERYNGSSWVVVGSVPADATSFVESGLRESTSYQYRVRSVNGAFQSVPSTEATGSTVAFRTFHDNWPTSPNTTLGDPEMAAAGIEHIYITNHNFYNSDGSPNQTLIAQVVGTAVSQHDHIFVFDTEGFAEDIRNWWYTLAQNKTSVRNSLDWLKQAVTYARAAVPAGYSMKFGFWNDFSLAPPTDVTRADLFPRWHEAVDFLMGIDGSSYDAAHDVRTFVDFVTTGLYTAGDPTEWGRYAQSVLQETARFGVPVYAWLDPVFLDGPLYGTTLSGPQWRHELELVRQVADGLDIWGWTGWADVGWGGAWSPTAPWWVETQSFLAQSTSTAAPNVPTNLVRTPGPRLTWSAPATDASHGAPQGYIIEKQSNGGSWEIAGETRETTWTDPQVHVGPSYAYRVKAFNAFGSSGTVATTAAVAQRDAFAYTPAVTYDAEDSLTDEFFWPNHDGENTRVVLGGADQYVRYDGVIFSSQPTRLELELAVHNSGAGGVVEAWIGATTTAGGGYKIGTLTTQGTGSTDVAYGTYIPQEMLIKCGLPLNTPLTLYIVCRSNGANFQGFRFYTAQPTQDATTGGAGWQAKYGAEGKWIALDQTNTALPGADLTIDPTASVWDWGSGHAGALRRASGTGFVEGTLYKSSPFYVDVAFHGSGLHKLTAYFFQPDGAGRVQQVELLTQSTPGGAYDVVLDSRTISNFDNGLFLSWVAGGNVRIRVTPISGPNGVMSAVFVDPIGEFVGTDGTTQGNWKGTYGSEFAYNGNEQTALPSYLSQFALQNPGSYSPHWQLTDIPQWNLYVAPLSDPRWLQQINGTGRSNKYDHWPFSPGVFDLNITDGKMHKLSLYFNLPMLHYFVSADNGTHGNWVWTYGPPDSSEYVPGVQTPANVTFPGGAPTVQSLSGGTDLGNVKYVQNPTNTQTRTDNVAYWSSNTAEIHLDLPLNDLHEVALYFVSGADPNRSQLVELVDPLGRVLDSQVVSDFGAGKYLVWNVSGPVTIRLTRQGTSTGVMLGGIFFDQNKTIRPVMQVQIFNADTNELLDSRPIDRFQLGKYASWNVSGHIRVQIIAVYQTETLLEGLFLDPVGS